MSNLITFDNFVSLAEAKELIQHNITTRFHLVGEPGIGKTSLVKALREALGYASSIMSCPEMDLGDIAMPVIDHETGTTKYYPNARFLFHLGKPVIICLDEYTKGVQPIQNMLHPLLDTFEPRLGNIPVPEGSIIFTTGNLESDGVGDSMKAHTRMRVSVLPVSKPNDTQWKAWGAENGIHPVMLAWADRHPHAFASYTDEGQNGNELIFNPLHPRDGYFTPRTGELASNIIKNKDKVSFHALTVALQGVVGKSAAESICAFVRHQDSLPSWKDIINDPMGTKIPTDPGALAVLTFGGVERVQDGKELEAVLKYLERTGEWDALFCIAMAGHKDKHDIAFTSKKFAEWVALNEDLL